MFLLRFVCFTIYESPKFLMGKGDDAGAVAIVHEVARRNGKTSPLTLDDLQACNVLASTTGAPESATQQTGASAAVKRNLQKLDASHVKALFATKKLAYSTSLMQVPAPHHLPRSQRLILFQHCSMGILRPRFSPLQRVPPLHPSNPGRRLRRRQHLPNVPQLADHRGARRPRMSPWRAARRDAAYRAQRHARRVDGPDRCVPVLLNDGTQFRRAAGLELRVQLYE